MSILTDTIQEGFEELITFAGTTARFGSSDYPCLQGETQEMATLVLGGLDEELDGALVFSKQDFTSIPAVGTQFIYNNDYLRVENIVTDYSDATFTIAFSKIKDIAGIPDGLGEPSVPCLYLDGGVPTHECNDLVDGGLVDHRC
jgi:hypothetical protein